MELARGYLRLGRPDDAIQLYQQSLTGLYADDPPLLTELTAAYHATGRLAEARETFDRLRQNTPSLSNEQLLLGARIHEDAGELEEAAEQYRILLQRPVIGEEVRCRSALVLKQLGQHEQARALFEEIVRHARLSPPHYRKSEKAWVDVAKKEIAAGAGVAG
jgi:hypothetical protein